MLTNLPDGRMIDKFSSKLQHECSLCNSGVTDSDLHFFTCSSVIPDKNFPRFLRSIYRNKSLRDSVFQSISAASITLITAYIRESKHILRNLRLPPRVIDRLVFTYVSDLADSRIPFEISTFRSDVALLPKPNRGLLPRGIRRVRRCEYDQICSDMRIPLDLLF